MSIIIVTLLILIALALSYVLGYKTSHFGSNLVRIVSTLEDGSILQIATILGVISLLTLCLVLVGAHIQ